MSSVLARGDTRILGRTVSLNDTGSTRGRMRHYPLEKTSSKNNKPCESGEGEKVNKVQYFT